MSFPEMEHQRGDLEGLLQQSEELHLSAAARQKLQWFLFALDHRNDLGAVQRQFGISPSTFRRWAKRFDPLDLSTLEERSRRPRDVREPETPSHVIKLIGHYRHRYPTMGKERIQEILAREYGIVISPSTIGRVILRQRFYFADTVSHRRKRGYGIDGSGVDPGSLQESKEQSDTGAPTPPSEKESPPGGSLPSSGGVPRSVGFLSFLLACIVGGHLVIAESVYAAESASFRLYDEFPNFGERAAHASEHFHFNEAGITWSQRPLVSTSFRIVAGLPDFIPSSGGGGGGFQGGGATGHMRGAGWGRGTSGNAGVPGSAGPAMVAPSNAGTQPPPAVPPKSQAPVEQKPNVPGRPEGTIGVPGERPKSSKMQRPPAGMPVPNSAVQRPSAPSSGPNAPVDNVHPSALQGIQRLLPAPERRNERQQQRQNAIAPTRVPVSAPRISPEAKTRAGIMREAAKNRTADRIQKRTLSAFRAQLISGEQLLPVEFFAVVAVLLTTLIVLLIVRHRMQRKVPVKPERVPRRKNSRRQSIR